MKDKDFDEIGERLRGLEADPPKDGWKKIDPVLNVPIQSGKVVWLRKNWWKPLVLLIPVSFYLLYSGQRGKHTELASSLTVDSAVQREAQQDKEYAAFNTEVAKSINKAAGKNEEKTNTSDITKQQVLRKEELSGRKSTDPSRRKSLVTEPVTASALIENSSEGETKRQQESSLLTGAVVITENIIAGSQPGGGEKQWENERESEKVSSTEIARGADRQSTSLVVVDAAGQRLIDGNKDATGAVNGDGKSTADQQALVGKDETLNPSASVLVPAAQLDTANLHKNNALVVNEQQSATPEKTSSSSEEEDKKKKLGQWRLTAMFAPQFSTQSPKPVADDEVLVTEIEKTKYPKITGFRFSLGVGRAITPHFYLDGQLSFSEIKQDTYFSSSLGNVDTLIAIQQPDQSVRVTPVYEVSNREISSQYSYGGITLGGTYYFWSTPRRRFNLTANAGVHVLMNSEVKEKVDGQWVTMSNEGLDKVNYSLMIGAGYNLILKGGWEVMINPALTYYLRQSKTNELPYDMNQTTLGLNVMVSKSLGRN